MANSCTISLSPQGLLLMHLQKRDGTQYDLELPEGRAEAVLRELLRRQRQEPEAGIGQFAGATAFALKTILEALGQEHTIIKVPAGKKAQGLTSSKSLDDLGL